MKKTLLISVFVLSCCLSAGAVSIPLKDWKLSSEGYPRPVSVRTPSTVAAALESDGALCGSLMEGENYFGADKSLFDKTWTYSTRVRTGRVQGRHYLLRFNSLGFYADIDFNGTRIACSDTTFGVFAVREYDVTGLVRKFRRNRIDVSLRRAQSGDLNIGFVDWNPRALGESMGITGDVTLIETDGIVIDDVFVKPELDTDTFDSADLCLKISLRNLSSENYDGNLDISYENGTFSAPVSVAAGSSAVFDLCPSICPELHIDNPRVWWTWDLGTPELYHLSVSAGAGSHGKNVTFGVRSITSEVRDNYRQFFLNGRRVLVKGAGWTDDIFLRDTHESNLLQAEYVRDMNMNCIRFENIWCKDDNIYDVCDSLGLMAMVGWSCQWEWEDYCGLPETKGYGCISDARSMDTVFRYFQDQVVRLHNHPSIICWLTGSDRIPCPELEARYMEVYNEYEYRPYVCSAKDLSSMYGGPSGTKMEGPYEYVGPDYWYYDTDCGGAFGFNTETGIGLNIPQIPSLKKMMPADSLWPVSGTWDLHCTASSSAMNSTDFIEKVMDAEYGRPSTLEEFVNRAHALDYDSTRSMFEAFRCNVPNSTGIIQWMLNSAWPSLYWQMYDWYMLPTAAYYGTRKACEPVQLVYNYKEKAVYAVNESGRDCELDARMRIFDSSSALLIDLPARICATDNRPVKVFDVPEHDGGVFLALELLSGDNTVADNFYCLPGKDNVYDWDRANWYVTPITEYSDMSFVSGLPEASVSMNVSMDGNILVLSLENTSDVISYQNIFRAVDAEGEVIVPAFWSDNFVTLLPGQKKTLTCRLPENVPATLDVQTWNTTLL